MEGSALSSQTCHAMVRVLGFFSSGRVGILDKSQEIHLSTDFGAIKSFKLLDYGN